MPQTYITTSWDDGNPADMRIAELLTRYGLRGTFYIPRAIETGVMSVEQMRELSKSFEIGAHTLNHVFLADTDDATAKNEIVGSKKWVEDVTNRPCPMFCPPAGRYKRQHLPMFHEAGFTAIRTVEFMSFDHPRPGKTGLLEMPTTMQAFPQPAWNYTKNMAKRFALGNLRRFILHGRSSDWVVLAERLMKRALREGGVFHLWGHSWELEQTRQWARLEDVLRLLGEMRAEAPCLTNGQVCSLARSVGTRPVRAAVL
jgi:hypothetical protein